MNKKVLRGTLTITFILLFRLFVGIKVDEEFGEKDLFLKHRPTWKWKFYSSIGMSDLKLKDLSKEKQVEEKYYEEFVRKN